jgi:hypothetical protein
VGGAQISFQFGHSEIFMFPKFLQTMMGYHLKIVYGFFLDNS